MLVNAQGMTLYTFAQDANGKSACNGTCPQNWPPPLATGGAPSGNWTNLTRTDGSKQWAYKGHPLYAWKGEQTPATPLATASSTGPGASPGPESSRAQHAGRRAPPSAYPFSRARNAASAFAAGSS